MNVLFLSISFTESNPPGMYESLLGKFRDDGHSVYLAVAAERRRNISTGVTNYNGMNMLRIKTGNITGDISLVEKGISTLSVDSLFKSEIKKHFGGIKFDLILYPTPPITLVNTISVLKEFTGAKTYLLLKDIFPQNAVDLGMMAKSGPKSILYRYFRRKEKRLYKISDYIGCMSPANCEYVIKHNDEVDKDKVEVCPNCIRLEEIEPLAIQKNVAVRKEYNIPEEAIVFLYGGNLGRPQGIPFLLECLKKEKSNDKAFFLIVGTGTEFERIQKFMEEEKPQNALLLNYLPKNEYQAIANQCDVGMIFLDHRFTIPNFPSRLLSYLRAAMPVLLATDTATDMGRIAEENGFGKWCESNDVGAFEKAVDYFIRSDRRTMGVNAWEFLRANYTLEVGYKIIMRHFE